MYVCPSIWKVALLHFLNTRMPAICDGNAPPPVVDAARVALLEVRPSGGGLPAGRVEGLAATAGFWPPKPRFSWAALDDWAPLGESPSNDGDVDDVVDDRLLLFNDWLVWFAIFFFLRFHFIPSNSQEMKNEESTFANICRRTFPKQAFTKPNAFTYPHRNDQISRSSWLLEMTFPWNCRIRHSKVDYIHSLMVVSKFTSSR